MTAFHDWPHRIYPKDCVPLTPYMSHDRDTRMYSVIVPSHLWHTHKTGDDVFPITISQSKCKYYAKRKLKNILAL
jgi:hypothetical protein